MGTNKKFCCNDLLAPRYKLQPVMDSIYIAEGQNLKFGSVVDCKGFLCGSTHLEPYAILYEDCDTTNGAQEANVLIMGEFNIEKLVFGADATGDVLDKIVFYAKKNGIIIRPYDYAPGFTPPDVSSIEKVIPEGASEENKLVTEADLDEVTLDPSAVALGNVHLLDEVTSFAADAKILVDSDTNGPGQMPKDTLLELMAQNALAGNVAPAFDPTRTSDNPYKAGESVAYEGKTYTFKVDHYGAWSAADVTEANIAQITTAKKIKLDTPSLWRLGGIGNKGFYNSSEVNALCSVPIVFQKDSVITIKRQTGVIFSRRVIAYDKSGTYLGFSSSASQVINFNSFLKEFPTAKSFVLYLYSITGITVDPATIASTILVEDDSLFGVSFADEEMFDSFKETQKTYDTALFDFNNKELWHRGALHLDTGLPQDTFYSTRMYSDMVELYAPYSLTYTLKPGVTASVGIFVYDKDGAFLGWRSDSYAYSGWMLNNYTGACKYRIMIYNITGAATSVENLDNILSFSLTSYPSNRWMDAARTDAKVNYAVLENVFKKKTITLLKRATKLPCFAFTFDDIPAADDKVAALFERKGLRCGWAFIANDSNFGSRGNVYLKLQNKGHEVLNHSVDGKIYNTTNYATFQAAYTAMQTAYETMKDFGFVVNGFVAPSSSMDASYKPIIGMLNAFGFVEASGGTTKNDENTPVTNLHRYSIQSTHSLQDIKDWVDSAISNNELVVFYGHASDIVDEGDFTMQKIEAIIDYVLSKRDAGLCHVDTPTNIIREYYDL